MISQSERDILITIADEFRDEVSETWLERVLSIALDFALDPGEPGQISLLLTDDETVRELNHHFRGLDETTDVLSFSLIHQGHWEGEDGPYIGPDEVWPDFMLPPMSFPAGRGNNLLPADLPPGPGPGAFRRSRTGPAGGPRRPAPGGPRPPGTRGDWQDAGP